MKKRLLALAMSAAMTASLFAGCGSTATETNTAEAETEAVTEAATEAADEGQDPIAKIANSYFGFTRDVGFAYDNFFHFYDNMVYVGFAVNQVTSVYTYDVVEEERAYSCYKDGTDMESETLTEGTAPYTVNFYDYTTGELVDSCAYDGDVLYNDMTVVTFQGAGPAFYTYDADPTTSALAATYEGEVGTSVFSAVNPDDETGTLDLYHTGKYLDMVNTMIEGTYTIGGDGTYTLTPDSDSDPVVTVTDNGDGTCTYAPEGGDAVTMNILGQTELAYEFEAPESVNIGQETGADLFIDIMSDNTVKVYISAFGSTMDLDEGTADIDMSTYTITLHLTNAGDIASYFTDTTMAFDYAATTESFGDIAVTATMVDLTAAQ